MLSVLLRVVNEVLGLLGQPPPLGLLLLQSRLGLLALVDLHPCEQQAKQERLQGQDVQQYRNVIQSLQRHREKDYVGGGIDRIHQGVTFGETTEESGRDGTPGEVSSPPLSACGAQFAAVRGGKGGTGRMCEREKQLTSKCIMGEGS